MSVERGLPILRDTGCMVGCHVFVTIGTLPKDGNECKCGLMVWSGETAVEKP